MADIVIDEARSDPAPSSQAKPRRKCLCAGRPYEAGEPVLVLEHVTWRPSATASTVAHPNGRHFRDPLLEAVVQAADPNCRLSLDLMALIARRDIQPGEVISIDRDLYR